VREDFRPAAAGEHRPSARLGFAEVLRVPGMAGLILVIAISRAAGSAMAIGIPLILQEMAGGSLAVSGTAGTVIGLTALAMAVGAVTWGRLGDRIGQSRVLMVCLILSALTLVPQALVQNPWQLGAGQMIYTFMLAGLLPSAAALVGIIGPRGRQGVTYGASGTALALGNALGPSLAAVLIGAFGTRSLFVGVGIILFLLHLLLRRMLGSAYKARSL
jgi:MFS family permease